MPSIPFNASHPTIAPSVFIAPSAWIIGDVSIREHSSIFFGAVIRGDIQPISIGAGTNIQEHVMVHTSHDMSPIDIGDNVTVGHRAIIHGCRIAHHCLIGMGATILDNATIGEFSIIGAHTLILKGTTIPPRSLVIGSPGKVVREITTEEEAELKRSALSYQSLGESYARYFRTLPANP